MEFNVSKCTVMHIGYHNKSYNYFIDGKLLQTTDEGKDL